MVCDVVISNEGVSQDSKKNIVLSDCYSAAPGAEDLVLAHQLDHEFHKLGAVRTKC